MQKIPKPAYKKLISGTLKTVFIIEGLAFVGTYAVWYRLNTNRGKFTFDLFIILNHLVLSFCCVTVSPKIEMKFFFPVCP